MIGGDVAVEVAAEHNVPSLFFQIRKIPSAMPFPWRKGVSYAMDVEKKNAAQMETIMDYSFGAVVNVDGEGKITAVNPLMEDMLGLTRQEIMGRRLTEVFPIWIRAISE